MRKITKKALEKQFEKAQEKFSADKIKRALNRKSKTRE